MKEPLSILIFGSKSDERVIALKCVLLKCGVANFISDHLERDRDHKRIGLFIVSGASVGPAEMEGIRNEARRLAVPVLQL